MTILGVILTAIGGGDILRVLIPRRWSINRRLFTLGIWCLTVLALSVAVGLIPWWLAVVAAPAVVVWFATLQIGPALPVNKVVNSRRRRAVSVIVFLVLAGVSVLTAELTTSPTVGIAPRIGRISEDTLVLAAGIIVFLTISSNGLVRAALMRDPAPRGGPPAAAAPQLKGGRLIGPLERLALVALLLFGAHPAAAGLIAAKGIVRFPEIQADQQTGSRAEYFLVGSFVSWGLAIGATGLLHLSLLT